MADDGYLDHPAAIPDEVTGPVGSAGDYGKVLGAGALDIGSNLAALSRRAFEMGNSPHGAEISQSIQELLGGSAEDIRDTLNPKTKELLASSLTSPEFLAHPLIGTALKATGMAPAVAALAIPGGLLADVVGATTVAAAGGAALNAGGVIDEFYKKLDEMPDEDLQAQSAKYKAMREVMDEKAARNIFTKESLGWAPAINAILGAAVGVVGPAGTAARRLAGGTSNVIGAGERGALGAGAVGLAEGAVGNAAQGGVADYTGQQAGVEASFQKDIDAAKVANAALEGGVMGGLTGGVLGAVLHGKTPAATTTEKINRVLDVADADPATPSKNVASPQPKTGATGTPAKPVEDITVQGNVQNAGPKDTREFPKKKEVAAEAPQVDAQGPDAGQAAALAAAGDSTPVTATEHAAVTQPSNNPIAPPEVAQASRNLDTSQNVPEAPATLDAQQAQLGTPSRKAVMYPNGTPEPALPAGMKKTTTARGVFHYDPEQTSAQKIHGLSRVGRENEVLGLGPVSKPEAVAGAARGEIPVAVTERTPTGVEVKAAAGTDATAREQAAHLEATKTPGNVVGVETPENVVQLRRTGRILPNLTQTAETVPLSDFNKNRVVEPKEPKGKNYEADKRAALDAMLEKASSAVESHKSTPAEDNHMSVPEARNMVIERARGMVKQAEDAGVKIQSQIKKSIRGDAPSDHPAMQTLIYAKKLLKVADKRKEGKALTDAVGRFKQDEALTKAGYNDEVIAQRREEGDAARKKTPDTADATPESAGGRATKLDDASEKRTVKDKAGNEQEVTAASAASEGKSRKDLIAEYNAKLGLDRAPTKNNEAPRIALREGPAAVNRNPTDAQKEAGNYAKWHKRVEGLDVAVENPKGAVRRGIDPETGKPWEVKMPADYGYIKRTEGADGDHIDTFDGRTGDRNFIIDQLDHRTGEFDEHKVMLRFKDEESARDAYRRAFSDGNAEARLGHIHEVTTAELKDWLKGGDTKAPHAEALARELEPEPVRPQLGVNRDKVSYEARRASINPVYSGKAAAELGRYDFSKIPGVSGIMSKFYQARFQKLVGKVDVHYLTSEDMNRMTGRKSGEDAALGLHVIFDDGHSEIFVNDETHESHEHLAQTLMHEAAHAAIQRELGSNKNMLAYVNHMSAVAENWIRSNRPDLMLNPDIANAFKNEHEFMSEVFSTKALQEILAQIPAGDKFTRWIGMTRDRPTNMFEAVLYAVRHAIEKITGRLPGDVHSVLAAAMHVGEHMMQEHADWYPEHMETRQRTSAPEIMLREGTRGIAEQAKDIVKRMAEHPRLQGADSAPFALALRTFDNIAKIADHYFGENNPIRKIHNAIESMRVSGEKLFERSEPLVRKLVTLRAQAGEQFKEFARLLHDATVANVHPDVPLSDVKNGHLGKKRIVGDAVWSKAQHADLAKRFNALPPEFKEAWHEVNKFYTDTQNKMSLGIINNRILKLMGINDKDLGQRIHEGTLTDADKERLGSYLPVIEQASELSKIEGPYVPLIRRGDHVVKGTYKLTQPGNAKKISDSEFEFKTDKEATEYAKNSALKATVKKVWVDENTGEIHQEDPTTGKPHKMAATDADSVARYRVEVQNKHVEFHEGQQAAEARAAELAKDGTMDVHKVVPRAYEPGGRQAAELSASLSSLVKKLEQSEAYKQSTPTQKAALKQAIEEAAAASHGSTRIQSKSLPRRSVKGYSEDAVQGAVDYAQSSSRYLAKLEHMPDIEAGMKEMEDRLKSDESKVNQYGRTAIRNEIVKRISGDNGFDQGGKYNAWVKRAMAVSFADKLGSPAYSVINGMQVGMVAMPVIAARHGITRTVVTLGRVYNEIAALKVVGQGIKETGRKLKGDAAPDDYISDIRGRLKSADERSALDYFVRVGAVDPSAGLEVSKLAKSYEGIGGKVDAGIGYLEGVIREMPRAIEAINRTVTGIGSYRLERARGATHEEALKYAHDMIDNTQFNYSPTNAPPIFNHPLAKIALQFKKYGQGMYQLIGGQIGKAYRNASPGDRAQAMKTLIGIAGTHMAMAGALGLPTEPFKYLIMGANAAGLTGATWGDVEDKVRAAAAQAFGKTGGEVFTRGLPRLANLDLSRVGLDSITSFGEPRSHKESDVKTWLFDSLAGPVVALGGDWVKGVNQLANGDIERAAENLIPLKAASDSLRAYRQATEGKKSASGRETMSAYSVQETAQRMLGFGSGREAETGAANSAFYRKSQENKDARAELVNSWAKASSGDKMKAMAAITRWNKDQPEDNKIKVKELTAKLKRDSANNSKAVHGLVANKRDKRFLSEGEIYNTR